MDEYGYVFQVEKLIGYKADGIPVYYAEITGPAKGDVDHRPKKPSKGEGTFCAVSMLIEESGQVCFWSTTSGDWAEIFSMASS